MKIHLKTFKISFLFIFIPCLFSCIDKSESPEMSVERYVDLLKTGKYEHWELPEFSSKDISKLLSYRNEQQKIKNFPTNPISSYLTEESTLGMYILWTIESVRAKSLGSEFLTGSFPSQNPIVENRISFELIEQNLQVQQEIADRYIIWWESNKMKDFSEFDQIDPLEDTSYRWH